MPQAAHQEKPGRTLGAQRKRVFSAISEISAVFSYGFGMRFS
jgi:hypothetical protein